jgi:hypothetical protein
MGVVYLFGAVAVDQGFLLTRIQNEFPNGEAIRRVDKERWQRMRIAVVGKGASGNREIG